MEDVFVGSLMSSPVHTVDADTSLRSAGELMLDRDVGSVVVAEDDRLRGILTATDFVRIVAEDDCDPETAVETAMSADVVTTTADESARFVADLMLEHGFHHVPVVEEGEGVIGVITTTDLTAYVSRRDPNPA